MSLLKRTALLVIPIVIIINKLSDFCLRRQSPANNCSIWTTD